MAKLLDSTVPCPTCGEMMKVLLTGPDAQPNTRATYHCPNEDWRGVCQAPNRGLSDA